MSLKNLFALQRVTLQYYMKHLDVVTHGDYRRKGYATACLNYAEQIARENNCYKMMLLTGSKEESTLNFYRNAGYNSSDKTAFIQWIDM